LDQPRAVCACRDVRSGRLLLRFFVRDRIPFRLRCHQVHPRLHRLSLVVLSRDLDLDRLPRLVHIAGRLSAQSERTVRRKHCSMPAHLAVGGIRHPRLDAIVLIVALVIEARRQRHRQPAVRVEHTRMLLLLGLAPRIVRFDGEDISGDSDDTWGRTEQQEHTGVLDANGRLTVTLPTRLDDKRNDQDYRIEARVTDAANREVSGHTTVLATYGSFRLSAEPASYVYQAGQPVKIKVTAKDYEGKPVQTRVHLVAAEAKWDSVTHEKSEKQAAT